MNRSHAHFTTVTAVVLLAFVVAPASAVIIQGGNGTGGTTPPALFPYWDSIGKIGTGTAIYLGGGYGITAHHVRAGDPTTVSFGGTAYTIDTNSWVWIHDSNYADLSMFRITGTLPTALPLITRIAGTHMTANTDFHAIGFGNNRKADPNTWYLIGTGTNTRWLSVKDGNYPNYNYETVVGYGWDYSGRPERWGTNTVEFNYYDQAGSGSQATFSHLFISRFDSSGPGTECALAAGDSGSAAFTYENGAWTLVGMGAATFTDYYNHPAGVTAYTDYGGYIDLSYYRDYLLPEPATISLLACAGAGLLLRRTRRGR